MIPDSFFCIKPNGLIDRNLTVFKLKSQLL